MNLRKKMIEDELPDGCDICPCCKIHFKIKDKKLCVYCMRNVFEK